LTDATSAALFGGLLGNRLFELDETNVIDLSRSKISRMNDKVRRRHVELIRAKRHFDCYGVIAAIGSSDDRVVADDSREARPACIAISEPSICHRRQVVFERLRLANQRLPVFTGLEICEAVVEIRAEVQAARNHVEL